MGDFFKKRLFNNNKKNFDITSLPLNRRELFKKIFFTRFPKLLKINILAFVFFLPLIAWDLACKIFKTNFKEVNELFTFVLYTELPLKIILFIILFIGLAGSIYYIRKLSWGEPVPLFRTFGQGIKQSYKQFIFFGVISSLFMTLFELATYMLRFVDYSPIYMIIFIALLVFALALFVSIMSYSLTMSSLYFMKIRTICKYSYILTIKRIVFNTLISLITYGLLLPLLLIGNVVFYLIGIVVLAVIGISYIILVWVLYCNSSYDIYINYEQYPLLYRKGLKKIEKEVVNNA